MHAVVIDSLEEYLSGTLEPAELRVVEAHLNSCPLCREEVLGMGQVSRLFGSLRSTEAVPPSPGFYARVAERVRSGQRQTAPAFAGLFALDFAFGRRLVFASLLTLAAAGSFLVAREARTPTDGMSPHTVMAQQNAPGFDSDHASDNMLLTLTAYER